MADWHGRAGVLLIVDDRQLDLESTAALRELAGVLDALSTPAR